MGFLWTCIDKIPFNLATLGLSFFLPYSYYAYSAAYFYDEGRIKLLNFINVSLSILLILLASGKIYLVVGYSDGYTNDEILTITMHYLTAFLSILTVFKNRSFSDSLIDSMLKTATAPKEEHKPAAITKAEIGEYTWDDLVIDDDLKSELNSVIKLLKDPEMAKSYGITLPKGMLFNGPPGTGKTTIARVVANMANLDFFALQTNEIVSKWVGESERNLTKFFEEASAHAPAIIFIDEIDSIGKSRSGSNAEHSDKLLNQLLQLIDGVIKRDGIYIIAATNRADLVDSALRRAGRLNRTIEIGLPNEEAREKLFLLYTKKLKLAGDIDLHQLAKMTANCSAADIKGICNQAGLYSYRREEGLEQSQRTFIVEKDEMLRAIDDFTKDKVESDDDTTPKRLETILPQNDKIEKLTWDDIVIADSLKEELISVIKLLKDSESARKFGIEVPKGILLDGPPGTGKTTIAKVMANMAEMSFFVLQTSDIVSKWVGDSEKNLTRLFNAAAKYAPSILFIDEIDAIAKNRSENNAQYADNLLNHLLQLIDGAIKRDGIYIIGATNRADLVDPALKRGGRLTKTITVPPPDLNGVRAMLKIFLAKMKLADDVDLEYLAKRCLGKSGADIHAICTQAGLNSFTRNSRLGLKDYIITAEDIISALETFTPPHK